MIRHTLSTFPLLYDSDTILRSMVLLGLATCGLMIAVWLG